MGLKRWRIAMPWFEMVRLPAGYAGGALCWRGEVLWEGERGTFAALPSEGCRDIVAADAGKRVFGLAIEPGTLSMRVTPPWRLRLMRMAQGGAILIAALAAIAILVRLRPRRALLAAGLIGLAVTVIAIDDASFLGGVRPFDGGDDGLFYDGVGREILRSLMAGDFYSALRGGESVYWYGGPGLRYFRALEHVVFGESYLGYLSLILAFPFIVHALFKRFLSDRWALALIILFVAVPLGVLFGTSFVQYEKWASHGFADPGCLYLVHRRHLAGHGHDADRTARGLRRRICRRAVAGACDLHAAGGDAGRRGRAGRRRPCRARPAAMDAPGRPLYRLFAGLFDGAA